MNAEVVLSSITFLIPLAASVFIYFFGKKNHIKEYASILSLIIGLLSSLLNLNLLLKTNKAVVWLDVIYIDGFSVFMQLITLLTAILVVLFSINYLSTYIHRKESFYIYYAAILLCTGFMNLSFSLNNLFFVYVTLELSSIFAVYLISFRDDKESLYAGFKYLIFVNIGILFSLIGIILFSFSVGQPMLISSLKENLSLLKQDLAFVCVGFFIVGFFTKSGLVPFHLWLPDTYKESPTPITVFLSGALTKIGFYGLARTITVFSFNFKEIEAFLIFLSCLSMVVGAILAFNQKDIKKLIAYCSICEMGFIAAAFSLQSYEGIFGGVFHILNHTLMKGILFFSAGAIAYVLRQNREIYLGKSIITTFYFIGALSVGGMPLFGSFFSSTTIFISMIKEGFLIPSIVLIISEFIATVSLIRYGIFEFWQRNNKENTSKIPILMMLPIIILSILLIIFGIYPEVIYPLIDLVTSSILKTTLWRL